MAKEWNCTPAEAYQRMVAEGWRWWGYSATYGTELYVPPPSGTAQEGYEQQH